MRLLSKNCRNFSVWLALAAVLLFFNACANVATTEGESTDRNLTDEQAPAGEGQAVPERIPPKRPDLELDEDTLYKLLVAEIAGQRGHLDLAVKNYMELAHATRDPEVIGRATRVAVYARDDQAARDAAELWLEVDPDNPDAHQVMAVMSVRDGNLEAALDHLNQILKFSSVELNKKLWMIANLLGKEEDQEIVKDIMERLMVSHQGDPEALYAHAHVMARMGDMERSRDLLEKVLTLEPDNKVAITSYVSLLQREGDSDAAVNWIKKSVEDNPDDFELRLLYARLLTDVKQYDDARRQFEILVVQQPENFDVLYALGLLYLQANRLDDSEQYFQRLSKLGQNSESISYYLGRIAEQKEDYESAITWYLAIQSGENYFDAQIRVGMMLAKQDRIEDARKHIRSIRTSTSDQKSMLIQAEGEILMEEKLYDDALSVYNLALQESYNPDLLYSRAMLAEKMDRLDILERDLKAILEQDPENSQALNALGYTLADRTERYTEAYKYIEKALEISPNDFYILDSMGWVLYRLGRLGEAIEYLNKALALRNDPEIAAHLGEVLWVKGDKDAAKQIWETALQETPEDTRLLDVIKRFNP